MDSTDLPGCKTTNEHYPYLSYGTDWLAFGHLVIATAFIGPLRNPVKNIWIIQFGMIALLWFSRWPLLPAPYVASPFIGAVLIVVLAFLGLYRYIFAIAISKR